jgi:hypothetical protein
MAKGTAALKAKAEATKAIVRPVIAEIRATGITTLRAIAAALNDRGVAAPRGGEWSATQVARVLAA